MWCRKLKRLCHSSLPAEQEECGRLCGGTEGKYAAICRSILEASTAASTGLAEAATVMQAEIFSTAQEPGQCGPGSWNASLEVGSRVCTNTSDPGDGVTVQAPPTEIAHPNRV